MKVLPENCVVSVLDIGGTGSTANESAKIPRLGYPKPGDGHRGANHGVYCVKKVRCTGNIPKKSQRLRMMASKN